MKTLVKSPEPANLTAFRTANPDGTWDEMRHDALACGQEAVQDIYSQSILDQKGLCAYCECRIRTDDKLHRQIEHFHPKSDRSTDKNWDLDWQNMLAVCDGGSRAETKHARQKNLSCDASKKNLVYDGVLLNPLAVPPFPNLFVVNRGTGKLKPDEKTCSGVIVLDNQYGTTEALVKNTIEILNLNCSRLSDLRLMVVEAIENQKAQYRKKGVVPKDALRELSGRYFSQHLPSWPEFFTTIRCCLGQAAEEYLRSIQYQG
ncbi:MAG: TIGR02646 family protein [Deltaproteobacteria bacterium]|jgi:uncharacterized protein (TIGR02646 family)|nr:TIGR02646 family protein [Deltaproteobacteria bacterium]